MVTAMRPRPIALDPCAVARHFAPPGRGADATKNLLACRHDARPGARGGRLQQQMPDADRLRSGDLEGNPEGGRGVAARQHPPPGHDRLRERARRPALLPLRLGNSAGQRFFATVVKVEPRFLPTLSSTVTAAPAISAAIRRYSTAVAPSSFLNSARSVANIAILPRQPAIDRLSPIN